jgi:nonsense-mediated mRNA decay protein 3
MLTLPSSPAPPPANLAADAPLNVAAPTHYPQHKNSLCCLCGTSILPNPSNMCVSCIRSQVDITDGIQKQVTILFCKDCGRYLQPPRHWVRADPESRELLTFCIKRVKGLPKVKLVDAGFIWCVVCVFIVWACVLATGDVANSSSSTHHL